MHGVHDSFVTNLKKMTGTGVGLLSGGYLDEIEVVIHIQKSESAVVEGVIIEHTIILRSIGIEQQH